MGGPVRKKIKVLIVDDSAVVRQSAQAILMRDPDIEVIGAVSDPLFALNRMSREWPDVILLDIEMPRMDGLTFLRKLMVEHPTPVVICSTLTEAGAQTTLEALSAGAVAIISKPKAALKQFLDDNAREMIATVKGAAGANLRSAARRPAPQTPPAKLSADAMLAPVPHSSLTETTEKVVAIGTSTGGIQALEAVLTQLPPLCPGIVIVQHMPEKFTGMFAQRIDALCRINVREARDGDRVMPGLALIAPGGRHMLLKRSGARYHVAVVDGPPISRHRPSVDVLFRSAAQTAGRNAMGIIMTGMGDDGAHGLKEMRDAGAITVAEDESSCVVFGMPKEAIRLGGVAKTLPLTAIPAEIMAYAGL